MANSADPDKLASSEANRSGSIIFAKAGHMWGQQDQGKKELIYFQQMQPCQNAYFPFGKE